MQRLDRDQFWHYVNTATITGETANPTYTREGTGVESLAVDFNVQKDTFKDITQKTSTPTFTGYQLQSSVSGKRCYKDDPMYDYLYNLKKKAIAADTQLIEVNSAKSVGTSGYDATKYDVMITIDSWLGDGVTISYSYDYSNPVQGVVTVSGGQITFTESAETN